MTVAADEQSPSQISEEILQRHRKRRRILIETSGGILLIALLFFLYWWFILRLEVSTNDAYVEGDLVNVNARQEGVVKAFYADNTDLVEEGQLLVELDPTDYLLAYENARIELILQTRMVRALAESVKQYEQEVVASRAKVLLSLYDYENRKPLAQTGAISQEELESFRTTVEIDQANVLINEHLLAQFVTRLGNSPLPEHPYILQAKDRMREAFLRVERCQILSPVRGFVAQRNAQVGEYVEEMRNMMSVIPLNRVWITANFKETQLYWLRIGQPTRIKVDQYGHSYLFEGKLHGIGAGTGSVFSLLPPQNATGNWIKIVQRLPVRILLNPGEIEKHPLRLGLSCTATVNISNVEGKVLPEVPSTHLVAKTQIYNVPFQHLNEEMEAIVTQNLSFPKQVQ